MYPRSTPGTPGPLVSRRSASLSWKDWTHLEGILIKSLGTDGQGRCDPSPVTECLWASVAPSVKQSISTLDEVTCQSAGPQLLAPKGRTLLSSPVSSQLLGKASAPGAASTSPSSVHLWARSLAGAFGGLRSEVPGPTVLLAAFYFSLTPPWAQALLCPLVSLPGPVPAEGR